MVAEREREHGRQLQGRVERSLARVGIGLKKNAKWFLAFRQKNPDSFDRETFHACWEDLITLCQVASEESRRTSPRTGGRARTVSVRISAGSTYEYGGRRYTSGTVVDLPASLAVDLVRGASACYVAPPPIFRERPSQERDLNYWEYAATWPTRRRSDTRPCELEEREEYQACRREVRAIHEQIGSAIDNYLTGGEPIILLKDVCVRLDSSELRPVKPFSVMFGTAAGVAYADVEAPVLVRFQQVCAAFGRLFRRCPNAASDECQKLYVAGRQDQRFCCGRCRARVGMKANRQSKAAAEARAQPRKGAHHGAKKRKR